ncbi:helix-turn-helix domain-containing protein [Curtobacterium sp. NPDC090217]|uniref:helix-turn-helix domain-containing protein n=1 Tax=Curtobacterium sp. NPDC090217 TaxID=3363970 RepID=UPI003810575B
MADALRALVDAVGLDVAYCAELEADPDSAWTHHFPTARSGHLWIATQSGSIWVGRGDETELLQRGSAALIAPGAPAWVGTSSAHDPPPRVSDTDAFFGLPFHKSGVHHGSAKFGPLASEALPIPDFVSTIEHPVADVDVALTLQHMSEQAEHRWPGPQQDALARMLVVTLVAAWRPPVLRDNSLTRCINAMAEPGRLPTVPELAALANVSPSTLLRRFRAQTGLTPDEFSRWLRTLEVRTALRLGAEPTDAARRFGFRSAKALRRTLARVDASADDIVRAGPGLWIR